MIAGKNLAASRSQRHSRSDGLALLFLAALFSAPVGAAPLSCGDEPEDASRIVVAGGSLAEILYALDEEERIVAVDRTATYPAEARALPQIGYVRDLSAEGLLSLNPSLVLGEHDAGPPEVLAQLESLGVDLLLVPEVFTVDGIRDKIRCVAAAVGRHGAGDALAERVLADLAPDEAPMPASAKKDDRTPAGIVLLGLREGAPVAAGVNTSGQGLLVMAGTRNLMDFEGWKPVSVEAMVAARPEFIVIPERGVNMAGGLDRLLEHPALRLTPAARQRRVIVMDGMAMLGFGPRTAAAAARLRAELLSDARG